MERNGHKTSSVIALIPARWGSTRFPGKMLAPIQGISLIRRTLDNVNAMHLFDAIYVLTDDPRIAGHVKDAGGIALMTSVQCESGSDRMVEAMRLYPELQSADILVNIQGDEPCLRTETVRVLLEALDQDSSAVLATPISRLGAEGEIDDPSIVKCVVDLKGTALYFSRSPIPYGGGSKENYYKHIGVYAYRKEFLQLYGSLPSTPLQRDEDLEQLKILEHGYRIKTALVEDPCIGVNLPEDINKVEKFLCKQSTSSSPAASSLA